MEFDPERPSAIHSDKAVRRILKTLNKLRSAKTADRTRKCEELIRFITKTMKDRLHDDLLQTTALWSLLNLLRMDTKSIQPIMLRCGVPGVIYDAMSISRPQHTSHYSSQLCTLLCSATAEPLVASSSILKTNQVFENFSASVDSGTSTTTSQHIASFSPYLISDHNLLQMNALFEPLLPPISDPSHANMHQLGTALEQDSISLFPSHPYPTYPTSPSRNHRISPPMNPQSPQRLSPSRMPSPSRPSITRESQRTNSSQSIRGVKDMISHTRQRRHSQPSQAAHQQPSNDDILESYSSLVSSHGRSILPQHLSKLDPLSLNVTSALLTSTENKAPKAHRAESLIDMRFLRRIFVENVTVVEAQSLMAKMQDLFELFDKDTTGYLPYSTFTRILLSLAPPHMLRSDTVAFLEKQVDSPDDKIDYREFAISGKVLIIEQKDGKPLPLARSWYNHVSHMPLPATLTWAHHVAYFRKRKSDTIIWLMRRANRAIQYYAYVEKAAERLLFVGKQAKAVGYLLECSDRALQAERNAAFIRQKLLNRVQHARQWKETVHEAHKYLVAVASQAETLEQWRIQRELDKAKVVTVKKWVQPSYNRFYELQHRRELTLKWLNKAATIALQKMERREQHAEDLISLGRRAATQSIVHDKMQCTLRTIAEHAHAHCIVTDKALLTLLRQGKKAYDLLLNQISSLEWLMARGQQAIRHTQHQQETVEHLLTFAQYHTQKLSKRQEAFFYLSTRCQMVFALQVRQRAAIEYLRRIPRAIFENEETVDRAFNWLVKRAARGKKHAERMERAYRGLKFVAARSVVVTRRRHMAYADLKQLGLKYRVQSFEKLWVPLPGNKDRLRDEIKRIQQLDRRTADERRYLSLEEYIRAELRDAFDILSNAYHSAAVVAADAPVQQKATEVIRRADSGVSIMGRGLTTRVVAPKFPSDKEPPSSPTNKPSSPTSLSTKNISNKFQRPTTPGGSASELGRIGFKKLIMDGKLLGLPKGTADAIYDSVDSDSSGCISFDELWVWFSHEMRRKSLSRSAVSVSRILPAKERAIIALMKRFSDKNPVAHTNVGDMTAYDMVG